MEYHDLERYPYINSNDFQDYEFYSDGPKGWIKKIVMFTKIPNSAPPIYNLGFGDQDPRLPWQTLLSSFVTAIVTIIFM
nr:hypothetical protein [Mucilaginibacter rubeus]